MDVDIIKIEGSVELAPLLELADGIVVSLKQARHLKKTVLKSSRTFALSLQGLS